MTKKRKARTIPLSDEWRQDDEPMGYAVKHYWTSSGEYKVFRHLYDATRFARQQRYESERAGQPTDWEIYPLYASHPEVVR